LGYVNGWRAKDVITHIRECNTWNTYVSHVLLVASGRYGVVGRTGLGAVLRSFLWVSDVSYTSRMVWYEHTDSWINSVIKEYCVSVGLHILKVIILWNHQVQTNKTIPINKPDIIIHDNEKGTYFNRCWNFSRQKCYQERSWRDFKIEIPYNRNRGLVDYKNKSDTINKRCNWNHFKIIKKNTQATYR
jgi:hypothetical protein